jgi:outer membrane protein assembly factor BamE (lipoprotein component of BamABCDE complex)
MSTRRTLALFLVLALFAGACATPTTLMDSREAYVKAHPELDPTVKNAILEGTAVPGMTQKQVRASCGEPNLTSTGKYHGEYCDLWGYKRYTVTFKDGKVVDVKP